MQLLLLFKKEQSRTNGGEIFYFYEYLYIGQTQGIDAKMKSNRTGFITIPDSKFHTIDTSNGKVDFFL